MIGTASVYRNGRQQCVDADEVRPDEIACCPVCKVRGITKYDPIAGSVIFAADKHNDDICKIMAKTKSIKRIRNVSGTELIENLCAPDPIKSRSKVLTLADAQSIGLHNASHDTKIKDGFISDFLLTNNDSLSVLRKQQNIGRRIVRAKLDFFDIKTNSIILIAAWAHSTKSKKKFFSKRLRLHFSDTKDFCSIRNYLIRYEMDERRFANELHYKGYLLVAGDWSAVSEDYCKWYCSADCVRSWQCCGMLTAEGINLRQIIQIEGENRYEKYH